MVPREGLYEPKRGIGLSEDWKPRLPELQVRLEFDEKKLFFKAFKAYVYVINKEIILYI